MGAKCIERERGTKLTVRSKGDTKEMASACSVKVRRDNDDLADPAVYCGAARLQPHLLDEGSRHDCLIHGVQCRKTGHDESVCRHSS